MTTIMEKVKNADGILWAFPLYVAMVHAGVKRFIELVFEQNHENCFAGKHTAILATSIHFFDHTAIEYVRGISEDLGMIVGEVFSAHMDDLTHPSGSQQLSLFFDKWIRGIEAGAVQGRITAPITGHIKPYIPDNTPLISKPHPMTVGIVTQAGACQCVSGNTRPHNYC